MAENRKVGFVVSAENDTKRTFEEIKRDSRDMAQAVAKAGQDAGKGLAGIGDAAEPAAQKIDRQTRSAINSIQRLTARLEAGSNTNVKYWETLAQDRGIDLNVLRPYLDRLEEVQQKQQQATIAADALSEANRAGEDRFKAIAAAALEQKAALDAQVRAAIGSADAGRKMTQGWQAQAQAYTATASAEHRARIESERHAVQMKAAAEAAEQQRRSLQRLLTQIDPLEGKLNKLDELEEQLHETFRQGAVDADTYAEALAKIHGQRNEAFERQMKQMSAGAKDAASSIRILGINSAQSQRDVMSLSRAVVRGDWAQASSSAMSLTRSTGLMSSAFFGAAAAAGVAVAGITALGVAYHQGRKETEEFNRTLIMTGGAVGLAADQLNTMSQRLGGVVGTQRRAAAALNEFAGSGRIAAENLERFAASAIDWERATGTAISDTVKQFEELGKAPVEASLKLNESMNYLTTSTYQQIKALQDSGRETEAAALAQKLFADTIDQRSPQILQQVGAIERAWHAVKGAVTGAVDAMMDIGRPETIESLNDRLQNRLKQLAALQEGARFTDTPGGAAIGHRPARNAYAQGVIAQEAQQLAAEIQMLQQQLTAAQIVARKRKELEEQLLRDKYVGDPSRQTREQQRIAAIKAEEKAFNDAVKGLARDTDQYKAIYAAYRQALVNIDKQFEERRASGGISTTQSELARLNSLIEAERQREAILHDLTVARTDLNEGERLAIQYGEKLKLVTDQRTRSQLQVNKAKAEEYGALRRANDEYDRQVKAAESTIARVRQQTSALEDQVATYGLGKSAIEALTIAELEHQLAVNQSLGASERTIELLRTEIHERHKLLNAMRAKEALDAQLKEWQAWEREVDRIFDQLGQSLTDQLFEGGKSARDAIRDLFKNMVLRVAIQPVMGAMQGWVTQNVGGMLGLQNPAQGGGMFGLAQNASSLHSAFTGGFTDTLAGGINWLGEQFGSSALQSFAAGMTGTATVASTTLGAATMVPGLGVGLTGGAAAGGGLVSGAAGLVPGLGVGTSGGAAVAGGAMSGAAGGSASAGSLFASAAPWVMGGLAIASAFGLFDDRLPTTRRSQQGASHMLPDGSWEVSSWDDRQDTASQIAARDFAQAAVEHANDLFERIGIDAQIHSFQTLMESSILGDKQGVGSSGQVRIGDVIRDIGLTVESSWTRHGFGGWSDQPMLPRLQTDIQLTLLEAFQAVGDELPTVLSDMLADVDIRSLGAEQAQALAESFQLVVDQVSALQIAVKQLPFAELRDLSFDAAASLIHFAGGLEQLDAGMTNYFQLFHSQEERVAWAAEQMKAVFDDLGLTMPDLTQGADAANEAYRNLRESLDITTEEGQRANAMLFTNAQAFHGLTAGIEELTTAAARARAELAQAAAQQLSAAWSSMSTASSWAGQYLGNASGLRSQLRMMQTAYQGATSVQGREAALRQIIALEQSIWQIEQQNRQARADAAMKQAQALQQQLTTVNALVSASQRLKGYAEGLRFGANSGLDDFDRLDMLANEYRSLLARAGSGDADAMQQLQGTTTNYLALAQQLSGSQAEYSVLAGRIAAELEATAVVQEASAQSQADLLEAQIETAQLTAERMAQQFEVSSATKALITQQLADSAQQFEIEMEQLQRQIEQGDISIDLLTGLPAELTGVLNATLVPSINSIADAAMSAAAMSAASADAARQAAGTAASLAQAAMSSMMQRLQIPAFASGGYHLGGLRIVGERGPELEATGAARIFNAGQTADILSKALTGGNDSALLAENRALRSRVERLEAQMNRVAIATEQLADQFDRLTAGGNEMLTRDVETL